MAHWLFLPDDAIGDLKTIAKLSREKLVTLREFLDSSEFRLRYKSYVKVAELLSVSDESAAKLCSFITHLQTQRTKNKQTGESVADEVVCFLKKETEDKSRDSHREKLISYFQENRNELVSLFSTLPEYDFSTKVRDLETGPLAHLLSFRAYCDLRPVYNSEATEIISSFPVITLCLVTHSSESDETKEILVQLTESNINEFREQFDRLDRKISRLKTRIPSFPTKKKGEEQ